MLDPEYKARLKKEHDERIRSILEERTILYDRCKRDKAFRALVYEKAKRDCEWFIDMFVFTFDGGLDGCFQSALNQVNQVDDREHLE